MQTHAALKLVEECTVSVVGASSGTGWWVGPGVVATSRHVIQGCSSFTVNGRQRSEKDAVGHEDSDAVLVRMDTEVPLWMLLDTTWKLGEACHVRARIGRSTDSCLITIEGDRDRNGIVELVASQGQIKPGYSGSPAFSLLRGQVVGQVKLTRDKSRDLGGYLVPALYLRGLYEEFIGALPEPEAIVNRWRQACTVPGSNRLTPLRPTRAPIVRAEALDVLRNQISPGSVRSLIGLPGSGKTELLSWWMSTLSFDSHGAEYARYAYIDLSGYHVGSNPVLRALADQLILETESPVYKGMQEQERVAAVSLAIRRKLDGQPVGIGLDNGELYLATREGSEALNDVLDSEILPWAAVVVSRWRTDDVTPGRARIDPDVELAPLSVHDATRLLVQDLGFPEDVAHDACIISDADQLQPGSIVAATARLNRSQLTAYDLAQKMAGAPVSQAFDMMRRSRTLFTDPNLRRQWLLSLASVYLGQHSPIVVLTGRLDQFLQVLGRTKDSASHALAASVNLWADDDSSFLALDELLDAASRIDCERLLSVPWIDSTGLRLSNFLRRVRDRCTRLSLNEILGPVVDLKSLQRSVTSETTATEFLVLSRTSVTARSFRDAVEEIDVAGKIEVNLEDVSGLEILRLAFLEIESRFNFDTRVTTAREVVLKNIGISFETQVGNLCTFEFLADSCRGLIASARTQDAVARLAQIMELIPTVDAAEVSDRCYIETRIDTLQVLLRAIDPTQALRRTRDRYSTGRSTTAELIDDGTAQTASQSVESRREIFARSSLLDASASVGASIDELGAELMALVELVEIRHSPDIRLAIVTRVAAVVRSVAGAEFPRQSRIQILWRILDSCEAIDEDVYHTARYGDARPLNSLCRVLLTLASLLRADSSKTERQKAERLHARALKLLRQGIRNSPNVTTWMIYLRAIDSLDPRAVTEFMASTWVTDRDVDSLNTALRHYREWSAGRRVTSAREIEVELWVAQRIWARDGSLLTVARKSDEYFMSKPAGKRIAVLGALHKRRESVVNAMERQWGLQPSLCVARFTLEVQYQKSVALFSKGVVNETAILEVIDRGIADWGPLAELRLTKADYLRHSGDLSGAREILQSLGEVAWFDRNFARRYRKSLARCLIDVGVRQDPENAEDLFSESLQLLGNLEESQSDAAMLALRARLELSGGQFSRGAEDLWRLFAEPGPATLAWSSGSGMFELCSEILQEESAPHGLRVVADDFTNPRILLDFSSFLLRWFTLSSSKDVAQINAALNVMEGARILARRSSHTARLPFLEGRALLAACRHTSSIRPLNWAARTRDKDVDDLEYARRRLTSARDRSVGGFRVVVESMLQQVAITDSRLRR